MDNPAIDWEIPTLRWINRGMFTLALLGVLDTVHLYVQNRYGFSKGCLGFIDASIEQSFNCQQVVSSDAGFLFGISNTVLGISFFTILAIVLFLRLYRIVGYQAVVNNVISSSLGLALLYVLYLLYYQYAILQEYCLLCLISAALVILLFIQEIFRLYIAANTNIRSPIQAQGLKKETRHRLIITAAVLLLSVSDLIIADLQTSPKSLEKQEAEVSNYDPDSLLMRAAPVSAFANTKTDSNCSNLNLVLSDSAYQNIVSFYDPVAGSSDPEVTIVLYFDPLFETTTKLISMANYLLDQWPDKIEIVYKPVALSDTSLQAVRTLYFAQNENKFSEFLNELATKRKNKIYFEQKLEKSAEKTGLDPRSIVKGKQSANYDSRIYLEKEKAEAVGIREVPTLIINGRRIDSNNITETCMAQLVENAF